MGWSRSNPLKIIPWDNDIEIIIMQVRQILEINFYKSTYCVYLLNTPIRRRRWEFLERNG